MDYEDEFQRMLKDIEFLFSGRDMDDSMESFVESLRNPQFESLELYEKLCHICDVLEEIKSRVVEVR